MAYRRITDLASTSGSGTRDVSRENMDTPESFDDDDTESDIFESLPPSPDAEEFSWEFNGTLVDSCLLINVIHFLWFLELGPLPKTDLDPEPSRLPPPSSRSPSPLPFPFKSGSLDGKVSLLYFRCEINRTPLGVSHCHSYPVVHG